MDITNRKQLLSFLREQCDFTGKDELAEVKSFIEAEGHTLVDPDGNDLDIEKVWAKTGGRKIVAKVETEDQTEDRLSGKNVERKPASTINKAAAADAKIAGKIGDRTSVAKKMYDMRAKAGKTAYPDADMAEAAGAHLRLANMLVNKRDYSRMDEDMAICGKAGSAIQLTTGGAFVFPEFAQQVIYLSENFGAAMRLANIWPMSSDTLAVPRQTDEFAFSASGENDTLTDDTVDSDQIELVTRKQYAFARLPNELLDDAAINITDRYTMAFAKGYAKRVDQCYFLGDGSATYSNFTGITNAAWFAPVAQGTSNTWSAMVEADFNNLIGRVENVDINNCAFVCSRQFYCQVMLPLASATGRGTISEFLSVRGLGGAADAQWKGWPVYFSQVMPTATATSQKPVLFGDFKAATMIGDRKQLVITTSDQRYFDQDQFAIRGIARLAINCHGDGRGSTYGPINGIKTS